MERRSNIQISNAASVAQSSHKQDKMISEYMSGKGMNQVSRDQASNSNTLKLQSTSQGTQGTTGMKVLPPLKGQSTSLERVSGSHVAGHQTQTFSQKPASRHVTAELNRVENFKKRDMRGGKRARQPQLSVGQGINQRNSMIGGNNMKSERLAGRLIAQASPSTQDDSIRQTLSSKDTNSVGYRSNERLDNQLTATKQANALQVIEHYEYEVPMEEMTRRWQMQIERMLPAIDLEDISQEGNPYKEQLRQFAPEFSQSSYETMLKEEFAIGDYIRLKNSTIKVTEEARHHMVTLLEELNRLKAYKEETFYLACSLADRYLVNIAVQRKKAPCLIRLAITCTLMSAKLEQPISPSFNRMVRLVEDEWNIHIEKQELIDLEEQIIKTLDYELHYTCPIVFLERYQRIYNLDQVTKDEESALVNDLARRILRVMVSHSVFLRFKTSQMGACALILAINIHQSPVATKIGLPRQLSNLYQRCSFFDASVEQTDAETKGPLKHWNPAVRRLTAKCVGRDLMPCYKLMIKLVNKAEFDSELNADESLFPPASHTSPSKTTKKK